MRVCSENMFSLLENSEALNDIAADPGKPMLFFTGALYQEIRCIAKHVGASEFAVFLNLERLDENRPHFLATSFEMPKQEASSGGVSIDGEDCKKLFEGKTQRLLAHLHSHGAMGVFWSSIDDNQQLSREDLGFMDDYRFYVVVNRDGAIKASLVIYRPALVRIDATVGLSFSEPEHCLCLLKARKREIEALADEKISKKFVPAPATVTLPTAKTLKPLFAPVKGAKIVDKLFALAPNPNKLPEEDALAEYFLEQGGCRKTIGNVQAMRSYVDDLCSAIENPQLYRDNLDTEMIKAIERGNVKDILDLAIDDAIEVLGDIDEEEWASWRGI